MKTQFKTQNGQFLEVGDVVNTKTIKNITIINPTEILFIKDDQVIVEHINMLNQHVIEEIK
jgi:hypothetical protein